MSIERNCEITPLKLKQQTMEVNDPREKETRARLRILTPALKGVEVKYGRTLSEAMKPFLATPNPDLAQIQPVLEEIEKLSSHIKALKPLRPLLRAAECLQRVERAFPELEDERNYVRSSIALVMKKREERRRRVGEIKMKFTTLVNVISDKLKSTLMIGTPQEKDSETLFRQVREIHQDAEKLLGDSQKEIPIFFGPEWGKAVA